MKKYLALILAIVMSLSLVACGGGGGGTESPSGGGETQSVGLVGLDFADADALLVIPDGQRIHGRHEETGAVHAHGERFVIPARVLHDDPDFAVQTVQLFRQRSESVYGMRNLERLHDNLTLGSEHGHCAPAV